MNAICKGCDHNAPDDCKIGRVAGAYGCSKKTPLTCPRCRKEYRTLEGLTARQRLGAHFTGNEMLRGEDYQEAMRQAMQGIRLRLSFF